MYLLCTVGLTDGVSVWQKKVSDYRCRDWTVIKKSTVGLQYSRWKRNLWVFSKQLCTQMVHCSSKLTVLLYNASFIQSCQDSTVPRRSQCLCVCLVPILFQSSGFLFYSWHFWKMHHGVEISQRRWKNAWIMTECVNLHNVLFVLYKL